MRVWIVNPFDNLPLEGNRPQRYWLMSRAFARAGHEVTFWTSDFSHSRKAKRVFPPAIVAELAAESETSDTWHVEGFRLVAVATPSYRRNICLARLLSHRVLARRWTHRVAAEAVPDVVIASSPPLGLCASARNYCAARNVPLVVDIMDAWPETFERVVPKFLLAPLARIARANYCGASAISVVADRYRELAESAGATVPTRRFYHGIERGPAPDRKPRAEGGRFTLVYAGNMGASYDLETLIAAVKRENDVELELAGSGPKENILRAAAGDCPRIHFHGYLDEPSLRELLARADAAVVPMFPDSCVGVPYKLADYAAAGLPILNSLEGETASLIAEFQAGESYRAGEVPALTDALRRLRGNDMAAMRRGASELAGRFDADVVYGDYVQWICSVVETTKGKSP